MIFTHHDQLFTNKDGGRGGKQKTLFQDLNLSPPGLSITAHWATGWGWGQWLLTGATGSGVSPQMQEKLTVGIPTVVLSFLTPFPPLI